MSCLRLPSRVGVGFRHFSAESMIGRAYRLTLLDCCLGPKNRSCGFIAIFEPELAISP